MHDKNSFITLTYNDEHLPCDGSVSKREFQLFMKRLRRQIEPVRIKFYGCGEYGSKLGRPHYHILIFGYDFPDKYFWYVSDPKKKNRFSTSEAFQVWRSPTLERLWTDEGERSKGYSSLGEVNIYSAGYVARYIRKKIGGAQAPGHYQGKAPEFALMSRGRTKGEGIGGSWYKRYKTDCYPKDFTHVNGKKYKPPKYYDRLLMREDWLQYCEVKHYREEKAFTPDIVRRRQKEKYLMNVTKDLERSFENEQ